jgi:hypothetical protein
MPSGGLIPIRLLTAIAMRQTPPETPSFIRTWYQDYDYLYLLRPSEANPLPNLLEEVDRSARFVLYKIKRTP